MFKYLNKKKNKKNKLNRNKAMQLLKFVLLALICVEYVNAQAGLYGQCGGG